MDFRDSFFWIEYYFFGLSLWNTEMHRPPSVWHTNAAQVACPYEFEEVCGRKLELDLQKMTVGAPLRRTTLGRLVLLQARLLALCVRT